MARGRHVTRDGASDRRVTAKIDSTLQAESTIAEDRSSRATTITTGSPAGLNDLKHTCLSGSPDASSCALNQLVQLLGATKFWLLEHRDGWQLAAGDPDPPSVAAALPPGHRLCWQLDNLHALSLPLTQADAFRLIVARAEPWTDAERHTAERCADWLSVAYHLARARPAPEETSAPRQSLEPIQRSKPAEMPASAPPRTSQRRHPTPMENRPTSMSPCPPRRRVRRKVVGAVFALDELMADLTHTWTPRFRANGVALRAVIRSGLASYYSGDHRQIREVLEDLLANACQFTSSGAVTLSVQPARSHVEFRVRDTGVGMDPSQLAQMFEGESLGLQRTRSRVRGLNGHLGAHSKPGRGTTFYVRLPLNTHDSSAPIRRRPAAV